MGKVAVLFGFLLAFVAFQFYKLVYVTNAPEKLELDANAWFGQGSRRADRTEIAPFKINVSDEVLTDLQERLKKAKIPLALEDSEDFEYGFNPTYLKTVVDYWKKSYKWRQWETVLNQFPQFTTEIEGLKVHFIHAKPPSKKYDVVVPVLISHGWPGNVFEFYKLIPMLTDPEKHFQGKVSFAFEVIAPSIPGYGWSSSPFKKGFDQWATARIFRKLMLRLGFRKFYVQGGDWGSIVSKNIAYAYPENVLGVHLNMLQAMPHSNLKAAVLTVLGLFLPPSWIFTRPGSFSYGFKPFRELLEESGYFHIQATKPDTVGAALTDSPTGLAAYVLEKFSIGTSRSNRYRADGGLTERFTMDEVLTIVTIYWVNGNIANSQRYYKEYIQSPHRTLTDKLYLRVPTAFAAFPNEMLFGGQPEELLATVVNLTRYTEMMRGGHFAALEEPKLLARDMLQFVNELMQ